MDGVFGSDRCDALSPVVEKYKDGLFEPVR
jgi:hypothetical protein